MKIHYVTGNKNKIRSARNHLADYSGFEIISTPLAFKELQAHDIAEVSIYKAEQAFKKLKSPLFVNDTGWNIPALGGFPGPFMSYVTKWFKPEDWLRLMDGIEDRRALAVEVITFTDGDKYKQFFIQRDTGVFIDEAKGEGFSIDQVVSARKDGLTIAEAYDQNKKNIETRSGWDEFGEWLEKFNRKT